MKLLAHLAIVAGISGSTAATAHAQTYTLDTVKQRGSLHCGVNTGRPGFSQPDDKGNWRGLDVDYCKAIAVAVLGEATKVTYVPTTTKERFTALQSGEVDVLVRNTTWTSTREGFGGTSFVGVNYYDGQGFMVKSSRKVKSVKELNDTTVCVGAETTTEQNLASYFKVNNMTYKPLAFVEIDETIQAYLI